VLKGELKVADLDVGEDEFSAGDWDTRDVKHHARWTAAA
jgi:hypothetical protein